MTRAQWREEFEGGSAAAEQAVFAALAARMLRVQAGNRAKAGAPAPLRTLHAKMILGVADARLRFVDDLPGDLATGWARPGAEYPAAVRLSNASGAIRADTERDMRGLAVRVTVAADAFQDLLMTNYPVSHARDARQFVTFAEAMAGHRALLLPRLLWRLGPAEALRMLRNVAAASARAPGSLARETYWSRGALLWCTSGPVRYLARPGGDAAEAPAPSRDDRNYLHGEIAHRLRHGDVVFNLCVQRYVDAQATPIEDGAAAWTEAASPPVRVATLTIPRQDVDDEAGRAAARAVDAIAFNPWNLADGFRPLGNLNRARGPVYGASAAQWHGGATSRSTARPS